MRIRTIQLYIFFLLLLLSGGIYSQNQTVLENLEDIEAKQEQDSAKVNIYLRKGLEYIDNQNLDTAILLVNEGLYLAKKLEYAYGIGELYAYLGDIKVMQNELLQALGYYLNSVDYLEVSNRQDRLANVLLVIGNIYFTQSNYPKALEYYQQGQLIADDLNLVGIIVHFYNNTGALHNELKQYEKAIESYNKALEIYKDRNDSIGEASIHSNLSTVYLHLNNLAKARVHLDQAFLIYEKSKDSEGLLNAYTSMAQISIIEEKFDEALLYYNKGLEYLNQIGVEYKGPKSIYEGNLYTGIGNCYLELKDLSKAEDYLLKGYNMALKNGQLSSLQDIALTLSNLYELKNNDTKAFAYYRLYNNYSDSLSQEANIKRITQLQMQFQFDHELKQREIEREKKEASQKRKELIYLMIIFGAILAAIILLLLFRLQKNKNKRISLERKNLIVDLDYKNKELTTNVMYLLKKNEFIISISDKLKKSRYEFKPQNRKIIDDIIRELEQSSSGDVWKDFEVRFQEVHDDFYQKLNQQFPDLSPNELKLCAFLRLNMSTKEISTITFQSPKSISMARFRLRKKMGIANYENLVSFLNQL